MRNSTPNKIWCRFFTNKMRCRVRVPLLADPSVSAWLTWSKSCFHLGNNPESLSQCDCHIYNLHHKLPCKTQRPCPVVPAHYSATPIASLAGSHNESDARDTGMDPQQLVEFVVDGAPTVVTQVFLPHLYFLSLLILICIDATTTHYFGDLDVSAVTLTFICKMLIYSSDITLSITMLRIADRGSGTSVTWSKCIKMCTRHL